MSQVPALIAALVARLSHEDGLTGVQVLDGPQVTGSDAPDWVLVGFTGDADGDMEAASTQGGWAGLSSSRTEEITLPVAVMTRSGDTDVAKARTRVFALADVVAGVLAADPSLGLLSMQAAVTGSVLHQLQTSDGIQARLILTLTCQTFVL